MLPGLGGEAVLDAIRDRDDVPVLIASAKRSDAERIAGLRMGADDYLAKPFNPHELTARVAAILRRTNRPGRARSPRGILSLAAGRLVVDPVSRRFTLTRATARSRGRLTPGEIGLLVRARPRSGAVLTREQLLEAVTRRPDEVYDRVVDVHVANLRRKLGDDAADAVADRDRSRRSGYRLVATRDEA